MLTQQCRGVGLVQMGGEPGPKNEFAPEFPVSFLLSSEPLFGCLHSCLPGGGLPILHTSKPLHFYFFLLTLILEKAFICFSEEATIETWTFREWEGNLLKSKEDCRCKIFVMLTPEQTYHCALAYLLPPHCLYWVQCLANCRHINQAVRLEQSHCLCAALSRPYKCVII